MIIIIAEEGKKICLGRIGENEARAVRFDVSRELAEFPGCSFTVLNMRPSDPDAYPVNGQFISVEGGALLWTLQSGDLIEDGLGECELKATLGSQILKDTIWTTEILRALDGNGEPPEPWESWQQEVEENAQRAEDAAEDSEAWAVGERGGVPVEEDDPTYHNNAEYWAGQAQEALASKADKRDTVLETTLSRGRTGSAGEGSIAFGFSTKASGAYSQAVGSTTTASGGNAHAEGFLTTASGLNSHAEGEESKATAKNSHAESMGNATAECAHAEGNGTASGRFSHAENNLTTAAGQGSHAEGTGTKAKHKSQHVFGEYNVDDPSSAAGTARGNYVEIVGNGAYGEKSNARVLDWDGNERLKGKLYVNANADGTGGDEVLTEHQDVSGKADKVQDAVSGNFAGLDAEGNLTDSGHKHSDYLTQHQDISRKADKVSGGTADNLAALDASGNLKDSGKAASDFVAAEDFRADAMPMSTSDPTKVSKALSDVKSAIQQKADLIYDSVENQTIATVPDGANNLPLSALVVGIEPQQDLHGQDSPYPSGGQLWDEETKDGYYDTSTGAFNSSNNHICSANYCACTPGTVYYLYAPCNIYICYYDSNKDFVSGIQKPKNAAFKTPANAYFFTIWQSKTNYGATTYQNNISINYPSTDTAYHPWKNLCPVTGWDEVKVTGTGKNLFNKATMTANKYIDENGDVNLAANGGISDYIKVEELTTYYVNQFNSSSQASYFANYDKNKNFISTFRPDYTGGSFTTPAKCSYIRMSIRDGYGDTVQLEKGNSATAYQQFGQTNTATLPETVYGGRIAWTEGKAYEEWDNIASYNGETLPGEWISDRDVYAPGTTPTTGAQVVYKLATPTEITLTDLDEISTVKGVNNIWADSGDIISMEYPCDTKLYVDKKVTEAVALILEN